MARLPHYLRTHRKRLGLSQDELAWLLGAKSGAKVSRYERFSRRPSLETALACEAIFAVATSDLFAGAFERVRRRTAKRAKELISRLEASGTGRARSKKLEALAKLLEGEAASPAEA